MQTFWLKLTKGSRLNWKLPSKWSRDVFLQNCLIIYSHYFWDFLNLCEILLSNFGLNYESVIYRCVNEIDPKWFNWFDWNIFSSKNAVLMTFQLTSLSTKLSLVKPSQNQLMMMASYCWWSLRLEASSAKLFWLDS